MVQHVNRGSYNVFLSKGEPIHTYLLVKISIQPIRSYSQNVGDLTPQGVGFVIHKASLDP